MNREGSTYRKQLRCVEISSLFVSNGYWESCCVLGILSISRGFSDREVTFSMCDATRGVALC